MTPNQIVNRVQEQAGARFHEVIERLLFLLQRPQIDRPYPTIEHLLWKWEQTGLLKDCLSPNHKELLAVRLEDKARELVGMFSHKFAIDEDSVREQFCNVLIATRQEYIQQLPTVTNRSTIEFMSPCSR